MFKLDKGFENDKISIQNFNSVNVLILGLFVIGGFLILENITSLISSLYYAFKKSNNPMFPISENNSLTLAFSTMNIILGCILIIYRKNIAKYFEN
ncbi:MAG: hypothetical protein KBA33_05245 [Cloacibacterium sp.]|nr:hypothetical protein [Cloacibacterium sp.]